MQKISNIIKESFTESEINDDWSLVDGSMKEKKELATKYNAASAKSADLKKALAGAMKSVRSKKDKFTDEDFTWFWRMDLSDRDAIKALTEEPLEFVKMFAEFFKKNASRYGNSIAGKRAMKMYSGAIEAIAEMTKSPETKAEEKAAADLVKELRAVLAEKMKDFKVEFLGRVKENSGKYYDSLPGLVEKYTEKLEKERTRVEELCKEKNIRGYHKWSYEDGVRKIEKKLGNFKAILRRFTKKTFVDDCFKNAEKQYEYNLDALAERINEKKLNISKVEISNVKEDPKLFEMLITDGTKKLYCRSIIAAQWSDKVTTHFRFIMTERH